jgi:hypothetical protein
MELSFREWVELDEAIKFGDILSQAKNIVSQAKEKVRIILPRSWKELLFRLVHTQGLPPAKQNSIMGLFNGVYAGKMGWEEKDNPYKIEDEDFYYGWMDGFKSATTGNGLLPAWFIALFGIQFLKDLFKPHAGSDVA